MNLIIITSDELRADACGFMGNPDCKTPNMDRLAERGVIFGNHFTPSPKCVPSRVAMMTGRYCHTDGVRTITEECLIPADAPSIIDPLKNAGYESAFFGHNHTWTDLWGDNSKSSGKVDYHSFTDEYFAPMLKREWPVQSDGEAAIIGDPKSNLAVGRTTKPLTFFCDDNRTEQAVEYLRNTRDRSRPFYLQLNLGLPHPEYAIEEPYFSMYDRDTITPYTYTLPKNASIPFRRQSEVRTPKDATEADFRQVQAVYYGMVTKMDALLGRLFDTIEEEDLWKDTVILFTGDHGDFAGQFGLPEKWDTVMHDCLLKVPMIIWAPNTKGGCRVDSLSDHTDLVPTLLELLDLKADWGVHGVSQVPAINGEKPRSAIFASGGHEEEMRARFNRPLSDENEEMATQGKQHTYHDYPEAMACTRMIRTESWKLVIREIEDHELYDLKNDPEELNNLYGTPEHATIIQELTLKLLQWNIKTGTDRPFIEDVGA